MAGRTPLKKVKDKSRGKNNKKAARQPNKGLTAGFLIFVLFFLAGTAVFMLVQHRYAIRNDLEAQRLSSKISAEKSRQERLRLSIARLKSPGRVARIASDELGLSEPSGVIYLKYERDARGNMVCQSTFEQRSPPEAAPKETKPEASSESQASVVEGPGPITRR
jgi:cell division protein FtsL